VVRVPQFENHWHRGILAFTPVFLRRFRDPIRVPRISNRVPRIRAHYHRVPKIRENGVPRIREIGSLQIHTGYLNIFLKKNCFTLSAAYINQSIKNWIRSTSFMRESFVDQLRESVSLSTVATRLRLNVCWYTSEARKYRKCNHNGGHNDFLLNCNISCKKHTANLGLKPPIFPLSVLHERFISKCGFHPKQKRGNLLKTNLKNLSIQWRLTSICRLKSEHNYSE